MNYRGDRMTPVLEAQVVPDAPAEGTATEIGSSTFLASVPQAGDTEADRNSYVEPPSDVKYSIGMKDVDLCKLIGPGYGTVHAPRCWWQKSAPTLRTVEQRR